MAKHFEQAVSGLVFPKPQHWSYGYPALLAITFFFGGETFKTSQWINFIAGGALTAVLGYIVLLIARVKNLNREKTVLFLLGAMIMIFGRGTMLKYQVLIMSDMMGAFWATLLMLMIWK